MSACAPSAISGSGGLFTPPAPGPPAGKNDFPSPGRGLPAADTHKFCPHFFPAPRPPAAAPFFCRAAGRFRPLFRTAAGAGSAKSLIYQQFENGFRHFSPKSGQNAVVYKLHNFLLQVWIFRQSLRKPPLQYSKICAFLPFKPQFASFFSRSFLLSQLYTRGSAIAP